MLLLRNQGLLIIWFVAPYGINLKRSCAASETQSSIPTSSRSTVDERRVHENDEVLLPQNKE